ncbi:MAG: hypothetical protein KDA68_02460 [Planctomycetaceae bacterium]|nr:hypothetical protein [Planctomycetaceae bacterium]
MGEIISIGDQIAGETPVVPAPVAPVAEQAAPVDPVPADEGLNDESIRRVQACLIACEGITTEDLERGIIQEMRQTLKDVIPLLQNLRRNCA